MFANIQESIKTYACLQICTEQIQLTIDPPSTSGDPPSTSGSGLDIQIIVSDYQSTATVMSSPNIIAGPFMVVTPPGGDSATAADPQAVEGNIIGDPIPIETAPINTTPMFEDL